jgi:hypothetical protein
MNRLHEYHWRGLDPLYLGAAAALGLGWLMLFAVAKLLPAWQMMLLIGGVAILTALFWQRLMSRKRSGAWLTETHLNVYYGTKHWTFPLSGIQAVGARAAPFYARPPHLELSGGRRINLPLTCLPAAQELRRWFDGRPIRVDAKITLT